MVMCANYPKCSKCGRAIEEGVQCGVCGVPLCHYDIRELEGYGLLCPRCYEDLSFQYHSKKCDISSDDP